MKNVHAMFFLAQVDFFAKMENVLNLLTVIMLFVVMAISVNKANAFKSHQNAIKMMTASLIKNVKMVNANQ